MAAKQQFIILYTLLLQMIFLTVAVVLASVGTFGDTEQVNAFAKWGGVAVLVELVSMVWFVVRFIFKDKQVDIYLSLSENLDYLDYSKIAWDTENCKIVFTDNENNNNRIMEKISLTFDHGGWKMSYSKSVLSNLYSYETAEIFLKDRNGLEFVIQPFKPLTRTLKIDYSGDKKDLTSLVDTRVEL